MKTFYHFKYEDNLYVFDEELNQLFTMDMPNLNRLMHHFDVKHKSVDELRSKQKACSDKLQNLLALQSNFGKNSDFYEGKGWTYGGSIDLSLRRFSREVAVIITPDGKIYEDSENHQYCFLEIQKNFFEARGLLFSYEDISDESLEDAINESNDLFKNNEFYGFDVYQSHATGEAYFVAHYPQNLDKCLEIAYNYACANELELATFMSITNLSKDACEVIITDKSLLD